MENIVKFKIYRYERDSEKKQRYDFFDVNVKNGWTVLDALNEIKWKQDGTLTYRKSCRSAICGSCAVRINGAAKLACKTQISEELKNFNDITVEPLKNMEVIKDLVVDFSPFWEQIRKTTPWLVCPEQSLEQENLITPEEIKNFKNSEECIMCGACYSDCSVVSHDDNYLGPAALVKSYRFVVDSRDKTKNQRLKNCAKNGLWSCTHTYNCIEQCPKHIDPGHIISKLREIAVEEGFRMNKGYTHSKIMFDSIYKYGLLDEMKTVIKTALPFGLISASEVGLKMALKRKLPPMCMRKHKIKDIQQIRKIYKKLAK